MITKIHMNMKLMMKQTHPKIHPLAPTYSGVEVLATQNSYPLGSLHLPQRQDEDRHHRRAILTLRLHQWSHQLHCLIVREDQGAQDIAVPNVALV